MIKNFNSFINENYDDMLDNLKKISSGLSMMKRSITPDEIIEDFFLEFKEVEGYKVTIGGQNLGDIKNGLYALVSMSNIIDKENIESEFNRIVKKLQSAKSRLTILYNFNCHFKISIGGKNQSFLNKETHQNDIYEFQGVGDSKYGQDGKGNYYCPTGEPLPNDKTTIDIEFYII